MAVGRGIACDSGGRAPGMAGGAVSSLALVLLGTLPEACDCSGVEFFCAPAVAGAGDTGPSHSDGVRSSARAAAASLPADRRSGGAHRRQLAALASSAGSAAKRAAARPSFGTDGHQFAH